MQLYQPAVSGNARPAGVRDRVLGNVTGDRNDALIFAASSVIKEVSAAHYDGSPVVRQVTTEHGAFVLSGSRVYAGEGAQPVVLVYAESAPRLTSLDDSVRQRFGLTRKEAAVALLLATDKSNQDIARELFISPHTARHHTQNVLGKLGVRSRREVAGALQGP